MLGHLFGLLSAAVAAAAVPESLQRGHQTGQNQAGGQDAEHAGEAVELEGASVRRRPPLAAGLAASRARPPLLFQHVQVALLLQL